MDRQIEAWGPFAGPPAHASHFRSDDEDEIHAFIAAYDGSHRRAALGPGPLGYSIHAAHAGGVDAGWSQARVRQRIRGTPRSAILHLPLARRHVYALGQRTLEASPGTAVLLAPGQEYTFHFEPGDGLVVLRLPEAALARELAHRQPDGSAAACARMRELPLVQGRLGALAAIQRQLVTATTDAAGTPRAAQIGARLCGWLADQLVEPGSDRGAWAAGRARVRRVEEWVDAHLAQAITRGRLCAVAGIGDRSLETAFRAHRGESPLQFVLRRRIAAVRQRLLAGTPDTSVTQVAHDAGFVHLGRFAARYRSAYGESPSATLRRAQARD